MNSEYVLQEVERAGHAFAEAREALRMAAVRAAARGASLESVAEACGVHLDTVRGWVDDQGRTPERERPLVMDGDVPKDPQPQSKGWIDYKDASA